MYDIELKNFQVACVDNVIDKCKYDDNKEIIVKAPTASGKTIMLINFIERYIDEINKDSTFIWLTPGTGELEEQSRKKMSRYLPEKDSKCLLDILSGGFKGGDTVFINWELINKKGNTATREQERKNLFDRIDEAKEKGLNFIIIIDEEHMNQTVKSDNIINSFSPTKIIRASATPVKNKNATVIEIDELDVIREGLICKRLYINEGVDTNIQIENEYKYLIDLAIKKRNNINVEYKNKVNENINPLLIIQLPNGEKSEHLITCIEEFLSGKGYTYEDGNLAIWLAERKENVEKISEGDNKVSILIMKQAISTGWDCPRAKILVKLRDNMNETLEVQIIGRIRRMPQAKHYENELLDNCFLYTFDRKYTDEVKNKLGDNAAECKLVHIKEEYKGIKLIKEYKNNESDEYGSREAFEFIYNYLYNKYKLFENDKNKNKDILAQNEFIFGTKLTSSISQGSISKVNTETLNSIDQIKIYEEVNTHKNGIDLKHSIGVISSKVGMKYEKMRKVLERLFINKKNKGKGILNLNRKEFYAFIINNEQKLKYLCQEALSCQTVQQSFKFNDIKEDEFKIPEIDRLLYNSDIRDTWIVNNNVYEEYPSSVIRSIPETKFERYCENNPNVEWFYKNGESCQQYFSIVYKDIMNKQWSFYPDYIVGLTNGELWIIETKGGEDQYGNSKNIDVKVENKFEALKRYSEKHSLNWGFVRDYDVTQGLYINNTDYVENMNDPNWVRIEEAF